MAGEPKTKAELICKYIEGGGVICKREGVRGTYEACQQCGWNPVVANMRKGLTRIEMSRKGASH